MKNNANNFQFWSWDNSPKKFAKEASNNVILDYYRQLIVFVKNRLIFNRKLLVLIPDSTVLLITKRSLIKNIAGRLPDNSRNRFVDRQSKKNSKKDRPKKIIFSLKADLLYFDLKSV